MILPALSSVSVRALLSAIVSLKTLAAVYLAANKPKFVIRVPAVVSVAAAATFAASLAVAAAV